MSIFKKSKQIKIPDTMLNAGSWVISDKELKSVLDNCEVKGMEDIKVKDYDIYHSYTEAKKMAKATNKADLIRQFYTELDNMGVTIVKDNEQVISDIILATLLEDAKVVYDFTMYLAYFKLPTNEDGYDCIQFFKPTKDSAKPSWRPSRIDDLYKDYNYQFTWNEQSTINWLVKGVDYKEVYGKTV